MAEKEALERLEAYANAPRPAVFQFQPERFEVVTGDQLQQWELLMRTRVGLPVETLKLASGLQTISYCGPSPEDSCDCDWLPG